MSDGVRSRPVRLRAWLSAIRDHDAGPADSGTRYVLLMLSTFMQNDGAGCFPSQAAMARCLKFTERGTQKALKRAEQAGWIRVTKHGMEGKAWKRSSYQASVPIREADASVRPEPEIGTFAEGPEPRSTKVPNQEARRSRTGVRINIPENIPENIPVLSESSESTSTPVAPFTVAGASTASGLALHGELVPASETGSPKAHEVSLTCADGSHWHATTAQVERWTLQHPGVDVPLQLLRMQAWLDVNPKQRKTRGGMQRFVVNWLGRAQDRPRLGGGDGLTKYERAVARMGGGPVSRFDAFMAQMEAASPDSSDEP